MKTLPDFFLCNHKQLGAATLQILTQTCFTITLSVSKWHSLKLSLLFVEGLSTQSVPDILPFTPQYIVFLNHAHFQRAGLTLFTVPIDTFFPDLGLKI